MEYILQFCNCNCNAELQNQYLKLKQYILIFLQIHYFTLFQRFTLNSKILLLSMISAKYRYIFLKSLNIITLLNLIIHYYSYHLIIHIYLISNSLQTMKIDHLIYNKSHFDWLEKKIISMSVKVFIQLTSDRRNLSIMLNNTSGAWSGNLKGKKEQLKLGRWQHGLRAFD